MTRYAMKYVQDEVLLICRVVCPKDQGAGKGGIHPMS